MGRETQVDLYCFAGSWICALIFIFLGGLLLLVEVVQCVNIYMRLFDLNSNPNPLAIFSLHVKYNKHEMKH